MKKSILFISLFILSILFFLPLTAEDPLHTFELLILAEDGTGYVTFKMTSTSSVIWEPKQSGNDSLYITTLTKYVDPGDITIPGNGTVEGKGWNSDTRPDEDPPNTPLLGRGSYKINVAFTDDSLFVNC